jgi:chromosomal replication initiation ATPase DnaA
MSDQLIFDLPATAVALGPEDFFVSQANFNAYTTLQDWEDWPERKLALIGPKGCGKTHLCQVFVQETGAVMYNARDLAEQALAPPPVPYVIIDDTDELPPAAETWLFHLHNHLKSCGGYLLMTSHVPPNGWDIALPDLASRLQATQVVTVDDPDDALLTAVITKLFLDLQVSPTPTAIGYLVTRVERSFDALHRIVKDINDTSLKEKREITRSLVAEVLDKTAATSE